MFAGDWAQIKISQTKTQTFFIEGRKHSCVIFESSSTFQNGPLAEW